MSNLQKEKRQQYQRRKSNTDFVFIKAEETQPFFMKELKQGNLLELPTSSIVRKDMQM